MGWNTKKWDNRLEEIINVIGGRAAGIQPTGLTRDLERKLTALSEGQRKILSNALHLKKQSTKDVRDCWRAIALVEKLYFHGARQVADIAKAYSALTPDRTKALLDLYIGATFSFGYQVRPAYLRDTAANFAGLWTSNVHLDQSICQNSVAICIWQASAGRWTNVNVDNADIDATFFRGNRDTFLVNDVAAIESDCVVVVYKRGYSKVLVGDQFSQYSHTMISVRRGVCMGSNNGCVGGESVFSETNLTEYFERKADGLHGMLKFRNKPAKECEVKLFARKVSELVN
jgi:hypothetical protein